MEIRGVLKRMGSMGNGADPGSRLFPLQFCPLSECYTTASSQQMVLQYRVRAPPYASVLASSSRKERGRGQAMQKKGCSQGF